MLSRAPVVAVPGSPERRRKSFWLAALGLAAVLVIAGWGYATAWFGLAAGPTPVRRAVAVLGFEDLSQKQDRAGFANAFSAGLAAELGIGRALRVVSLQDAAVLRLELKLDATAAYAARTLSLIRENSGAEFVIYGSYVTQAAPGQNGPIRLNVLIADTKTGQRVASIQREGNANDLGALVTASTADIRAKLEVPGLAAADRPFTRTVLPRSSEALALYGDALEDLYTWKYPQACGLLEKVIAQDGTYAPAKAALARAFWERGYTQQAISTIRDALNLSHELPREQRLLIESEYYEIESEWSKALEAYRTLFRLFPDNLDYGLSVASLQHGTEALQTLDSLRRLPMPLRTTPRIDSLRARINLDLHNDSAARLAAEAAVIKARERSALAVLAQALLLQGRAERMLAQRTRAAALFRQAQRISGALGDHDTETECIRRLADMDVEAGELNAAAQAYTQALNIGRSAGSLRIVASSAAGLGHVQLEQGNLAQADRFLEQSVSLMRQQQSYLSIPLQQTYLSELLFRRGDLEKASQAIGEALRALANTRGRAEVEALGVLARIRLVQGNLTSASQSVSEALQICNQLDDKYPLARALLTASWIAREKADFSKARQQYSKALSIFSKLHITSGIAEARLGLAQLNLAAGDQPTAASLARVARTEFEREDRISSAIAARAIEAEAELSEGRTTAAEAALRTPLRQHIQDRLVADQVHIVNAQIQAAKGHRARAIAGLKNIIAEASRQGLVRNRLQAELALAAIEPHFNIPQLASEAAQHGFTEIARRANKLRDAGDAR